MVKHRIQGARPDMIMRKSGDDKFEVRESGGSGIETDTVGNRIIELLSSTGESLQTREIILEMQYQLKVGRRAVEKALQELFEAGKVVKIRRGYYMLADEDEPHLPHSLYPRGTCGSSEDDEEPPF